MSYARTKVWVWFKGGLDGGEWRGGFYAPDNAEYAEAVTLQHGDFKDCVVPTWRISDKEPSSLKKVLPFLLMRSGSSVVGPINQLTIQSIYSCKGLQACKLR